MKQGRKCGRVSLWSSSTIAAPPAEVFGPIGEKLLVASTLGFECDSQDPGQETRAPAGLRAFSRRSPTQDVVSVAAYLMLVVPLGN
jgi:hypothetical protein